MKIYQKEFGFKNDDFENAYFCHENSMALPLHNQMSIADYERVVDSIKNIISKT